MLIVKKILPLVIIIAILSSAQIAGAQGSNPLSESASTPAELIQAVNVLRLKNGVPALNTHPILMQIAQIEVEGIAAGMGGHWRPNNITMGQWLLSLGYPLSGDLSLDGYRSENWIMGPGLTASEAILMWSGDEPHLNTMLSPHRSDIGAGVATSTDEWGQTVTYYVLETALQTKSGQMQYDAYPTLTALATAQVAGYGDATQAAQSLLVPQYILPVVLATARPDGDVIHEVRNGQSLWSIAIAYGVRIEQIRRLNNLSSTEVYTGEKLLVQKGATQPMPTPTGTGTPVARFMAQTPLQVGASTSQPTDAFSGTDDTKSIFRYGIFTVAALFIGGIFLALSREKKRNRSSRSR
ncbi:MAG: LysM peptidoglycan-binding domain-containing protein [Anaerolineaceae bacterium]|nr:LysM peptidoglycan-binding domain-containing protein [Anaerolineaceae bacterium]